jgi:hypothetical protein
LNQTPFSLSNDGDCGQLIVPISLRVDYLACLEALAVGGNPEPFVGVISRLIRFSTELACGSWEQSVRPWKNPVR